MLRKGVYPHEYMDDWEKFNKITLTEKEEFQRNLNMEDITDADYLHAKRVCKDFEIKNLGEYHDLYLKSDIYHLNPVIFLCTPGLAWQAVFKKTNVKLELLTNINMLLMVEKGIRGGICHSIH